MNNYATQEQEMSAKNMKSLCNILCNFSINTSGYKNYRIFFSKKSQKYYMCLFYNCQLNHKQRLVYVYGSLWQKLLPFVLPENKCS